jgi:uncharacterized membrane protein
MKTFLISAIAGLVCLLVLSWKSEIRQLPMLKQVACTDNCNIMQPKSDTQKVCYIYASPQSPESTEPAWLKYIVAAGASIVTGVIAKILHFALPRWFPEHFDSFN